MNRGRGRSAVTLVPLVALAAAWLALHAARPESWSLVPGGRAAGMVVVAALSLGVLATTLHLARRLLAGRPAYRRLAAGGFLVLTVVLAVAQSFVNQGPPAPASWSLQAVTGYGPLTVWPAVWAALPELGIYGIFPVGRVLVLLATSAALATAGTVALARHREGGGGAGTGGSLGAGGACALATTACPACAPPLASGLVALLGAGSVGPWLAPLATPGSLASEAVAASSPLLALVALMVAAGPGDARDPEGSDRDRGLWTLVAGAVVAGVLLAIPAAALSPMPIAGTPQARDVAGLYDVVHAVGLAVLIAFELLLVGLVLWNLDNDDPQPREPRKRVRGFWLAAWIAVPTAILVVVAVPSVGVLYEHTEPPGGEAYEVEVVGYTWAWGFFHPDGTVTFNELRVPEGPVHLQVKSEDVIHSVFVPDLGVKVDAVPGRVNEETFVADTPGRYRGACAEFCGIGHPNMDFDVVVES